MKAIKKKKDGSNLITESRDKCKIPSRVLYNSMKFFKSGTIHRGVLWPAIYGKLKKKLSKEKLKKMVRKFHFKNYRPKIPKSKKSKLILKKRQKKLIKRLVKTNYRYLKKKKNKHNLTFHKKAKKKHIQYTFICRNCLIIYFKNQIK